MNKLNIKSTITLNNGVKMPLLGLGTYQIQSNDMERVVRKAIEEGYLLIDTASSYRQEEALGNVLSKLFKEGKIKREDIFITSKAGTGEHGFENAIEACNNSLKRLQLDYLDMYLIHWPGVKGLQLNDPKNSEMRAQTWKAFEKLYQDKKVRAIGVSNYTIPHLQELLSQNPIIKPTLNQVEFHPFLNQNELFEFCKKNDIVLEAYSSLTRGEKLNDDKIVELAKELGKTRSQLLLRWAIQKDIIVIPKSSNDDRIKENCNLYDFEIPKEMMDKLDQIGIGNEKRICWNPQTVL